MYYFFARKFKLVIWKAFIKINFLEEKWLLPQCVEWYGHDIYVIDPIFGIIKKASMLLIGIFHMFAKRESLKVVN